MTSRGNPPSVEAWLERAEHDLRNAEHTLTLQDECPFDTVCFHAQQCAEKYLKALLVARGVQVRASHDLLELLGILPEADRVALNPLGADELTPYSIEGRYPGPWGLFTREEAETAVALARGVRDAVIELLRRS